MNPAERHRSPVKRQLEAYQESWKEDHSAAMACRDWEDAIAIGINIFHMLQEREQSWRDQVFRGTLPFSKEDDLDHQGRYTDWLDTTKEVLATILPELETRFGTIKGAGELRRCFMLGEQILLGWQPPRLSLAVGLREMILTPEAADELNQAIEQARTSPPTLPNRRLEIKDASFLK